MTQPRIEPANAEDREAIERILKAQEPLPRPPPKAPDTEPSPIRRHILILTAILLGLIGLLLLLRRKI